MRKVIVVLAVLMLSLMAGATGKSEVNVFTDRHYEADQKLFEEFEKDTGIKVNVLKGNSDELLERLAREGANTQADIFITADAGRLHRANEKGLLKSITSKIVTDKIPKNLRDRDNNWTALTVRARVIAYSKDRVNASELSTYEDLASEKWKKRVVMRSSTNIYNQSILSSFIALSGEVNAAKWVEGIVANFARPPKGNDRDQVKSIAGGEGDISLINTYYYGTMLNSSDKNEVEAAKKVGIFFPNQNTSGTHINISGAGVSKYAKNEVNGIKLIEFLVSEKAQSVFAEANYEYPANQKVEPSQLLKSWGTFKRQNIDITLLGENNFKAIRIFDENKWK